jgi:hypothetical protein
MKAVGFTYLMQLVLFAGVAACGGSDELDSVRSTGALHRSAQRSFQPL